MAGYSSTPLENKLGIKEAHTVFLDAAPDGFELDAPVTTKLPQRTAITLTFHTDANTLAERLPILIEHTEQVGMIWVCWPKKTARKLGYETDLDDGVVRRIGLEAGMVDVKVCAINEIWSALKFVRRVADRV
jgi:hypothetical protein